jgi:hypothetical protein
MLTIFLMESGFGESFSKFSEIFKDFAQFLFYLQCKKCFASKLYVVSLESAPTAVGKILSILSENAEGSSSSFFSVQNKFTSLLQSRVLKSV